ncbi:MAG: hypothetical protein O9262_15210 [Cyclobacteriaceae bacterium]|nr:hypothetical protein [Cyclobacteriaceae bacterium]
MGTITQGLLSNWHFMRWLRLILGLFIGYQAYAAHDAFAGIIAALFLFQAVTNTGCCGASGCAVPTKKPDEGNAEAFSYEEVKPTLPEASEKTRSL